jgi:DMSO/TMAO reductase YedYZ molybdopterin-dependent catalytic subunit
MKTGMFLAWLIAAAGLAALAAGCRTPFTATPNPAGEVEATEYKGVALTHIQDQRNNALKGTQHLDRDTYVLTVDGEVDNPLKLKYEDLLALPQESRLSDLNCVEGWKFTAKWTGPQLATIFDKARVRSTAFIAIFHSSDVPVGYSSLDLSYIRDNKIIIALKDNDITLPDDRGFPFQVVAMSKFGYKWAKWITEIELSSNTAFKGYWESYGYSNNADITGPSFEP